MVEAVEKYEGVVFSHAPRMPGHQDFHAKRSEESDD